MSNDWCYYCGAPFQAQHTPDCEIRKQIPVHGERQALRAQGVTPSALAAGASDSTPSEEDLKAAREWLREHIVGPNVDPDQHGTGWPQGVVLLARFRAQAREAAAPFAVEALAALQETTGSNNAANPWLGVCAAVALWKMRLAELEKERDEALACHDCKEFREHMTFKLRAAEKERDEARAAARAATAEDECSDVFRETACILKAGHEGEHDRRLFYPYNLAEAESRAQAAEARLRELRAALEEARIAIHAECPSWCLESCKTIQSVLARTETPKS